MASTKFVGCKRCLHRLDFPGSLSVLTIHAISPNFKENILYPENSGKFVDYNFYAYPFLF